MNFCYPKSEEFFKNLIFMVNLLIYGTINAT